jgi:hypothetical protein
MPKDLVLFRRHGAQIIGDILEDKFSFNDDNVGRVTHRQREISHIAFEEYSNKDEMRLLNHTLYVGKVLTKSITIAVEGSNQQVKVETGKIKLIQFDFLERGLVQAWHPISARLGGHPSPRKRRKRVR